MDFSKHCKIIKDMDEKIMNGERLCADLVQTLTALRDVVAQSEAHNRKMADRINAIKKQADEWHDHASQLEAELMEEKAILRVAHRHFTKRINVANRRVGIWRSKVERLKTNGAK